MRGSGLYGPAIDALTPQGDRLAFATDDGVHGKALWRTDGTGEGTTLVKDIRPASSRAPDGDWSVAADRAYQVASDGVHGPGLWSTDGTTPGTYLISTVKAGALGPVLLGPAGLAFIFGDDDGEGGWGIWRTDGTQGGDLPAGRWPR